MDIAPATIDETLAAYRDREPLYPVESEAIQTLPNAFRSGDYGWRDAEWIVRWYGRRFLGATDHRDRRRREAQFSDAEFEAVREAIAIVAGSDTERSASNPEACIERFLAVPGVDVPVASAFCMFARPERFIVCGEREWRVVAGRSDLRSPYPDPPSTAEYGEYLRVCRDLADTYDLTLWELYMEIWRRWTDLYDGE